MPKNNNSANNPSPVDEKWVALEQLNNSRNKFGRDCSEKICNLRHGYQPFCFKDAFSYFNNKAMLHLLSLLDKQLSKMEVILQKAEEGWEQRFNSEKMLFKNHEADAESFLKNLSAGKMNNEGFDYFQITENFKKYLADKEKYIRYDDALRELDKFVITVDKYRQYFNIHELMSETIAIRNLINEIEYNSDLNPEELNSLQIQLEKTVNDLKESMHVARLRCEAEHQSLQDVVKDLLPPRAPTARLFSQTATAAQRSHCPYGLDDETNGAVQYSRHPSGVRDTDNGFVAPPLNGEHTYLILR